MTQKENQMAPQMRQSAGRTMTQAQDPIQAQRYATQRPYSPEDLSQPLYDRVQYPAAGVNQLIFYAQQLGQIASLNQAGVINATKSKTYRDTNMDNGSVVPTKRYTFIGLAMNFIPVQQVANVAATVNIVDDVMRLLYGGYLEFRIVDKPLLYLPLTLVPSSLPFSAIATTANNSTLVGMGVSAAIPYPMYKFSIPITLNPYENFRFQCSWDGAVVIGQATDIQSVLHAYMRRPS